jgi:predicted nucleotidyltransferase
MKRTTVSPLAAMRRRAYDDGAMGQLEEIQEHVRIALEPFGDLAFAVLFGSAVSGRLREDSDLDVAVYVASGRSLEIETTRELPDEGLIQLRLEQASGRNVDLLTLNRAPAAVCASAITTGVPVLVRDEALYSRYRLAIMDVARDFLETEREWREIRSPSASLSEQDRRQ